MTPLVRAAALVAAATQLTADSAVEPPTIATTLGPVTGAIAHTHNGSAVHTFLGIPFAAPPVGEGRFAAPAAHPPWTQPRPALQHGNCCPQGGGRSGSEDCLVLDVYAPEGQKGGSRAIMVWLYGGGFQGGCISGYDGTTLAADTGNIVVAVNCTSRAKCERGATQNAHADPHTAQTA